ncbi:MAG: hypothetical protein ACM3YM_08520 [Sphingomonadales bacterium]
MSNIGQPIPKRPLAPSENDNPAWLEPDSDADVSRDPGAMEPLVPGDQGEDEYDPGDIETAHPAHRSEDHAGDLGDIEHPTPD